MVAAVAATAHRNLSLVAVLFALHLLGAPAATGAFVVADSADDVCSPAADPCNVTTEVRIEDGATLDFGVRTLSVTGKGSLRTGSDFARIRCGNFVAATPEPAIVAKGRSDPSDPVIGGYLIVEARRSCSVGARSCLVTSDCQLGLCSARRCTRNPSQVCDGELGCQFGVCQTNRRCSQKTSARCLTNADCDLGECPSTLSCANAAENPVVCTSDAECDLGTCSVGSGSIDLGGAVAGNARLPAGLELHAADDVLIRAVVNLTATSLEGDGSEVEIEAVNGSVQIESKLMLRSGSDGGGCTLDVHAGEDIVVAAEIDCRNGEFGGGNVELVSGRDLIFRDDLLLNGFHGESYGGFIDAKAGRDILVGTASEDRATRIVCDGHSGEDGGDLEWAAVRDFRLAAGSELRCNGKGSLGYGGSVEIETGRDLTIEGAIGLRSEGKLGGGGYVELVSGGRTRTAHSASIDLRGGEEGGGYLELRATGDVVLAGTFDATTIKDAPGGWFDIIGQADATLEGTMVTSGSDVTEATSLEACRVTLATTAVLRNDADFAANELTARESMRLESGSVMSAPQGSNYLSYRTSAKPPILAGTVIPTPLLSIDPDLEGCPVCGNGEVDASETCDDGNTMDGDGCSGGCQSEGCISDTPEYPATDLCDDGSACTVDVCETESSPDGRCEHREVCDDGLPCTHDSCAGLACLHEPDDSLCDGDDPCLTGICSPSTGCVQVANALPCDDANPCTAPDFCTDGTCRGEPIPGCVPCGDGNVDPGEDCDDGDTAFVLGDFCRRECSAVPCGRPTDSPGTIPRAADALFVLRAAVGERFCDLRVCDVDGSGATTALDALLVLGAATGQTVTFACPA